jgi:hypothetical protein
LFGGTLYLDASLKRKTRIIDTPRSKVPLDSPPSPPLVWHPCRDSLRPLRPTVPWRPEPSYVHRNESAGRRWERGGGAE